MSALPAGWGYLPPKRPRPAEQVRPKGPSEQSIVRDVLACRDVLNLSTFRLVADIRARYGVAGSTAYRVVTEARRAA